jgi:hypothetical protein
MELNKESACILYIIYVHFKSELLYRFNVDIFEVKLSEQAKDKLKNVPIHIAFKLQAWISGIKTLYQAKQSISGFLHYK